MRILIELPDEEYYRVKNLPEMDTTIMNRIVRDGIVLPEEHGDLIDADKFIKDNEAYTGWILNSSDWGGENAYKDTLEDLVNEAPTIIEKDKGSEP